MIYQREVSQKNGGSNDYYRRSGKTMLPRRIQWAVLANAVGRAWKVVTENGLRLAHIQKNENNRCWHGYREKGILHHWSECWLFQPFWKIQTFLRKQEIELLFDPAIPFQEYTLGAQKEKHAVETPSAHLCSLLHYSQRPETGSNPCGTPKQDWTKKLWYIYTMENYAVNKIEAMPWHYI